MSINRVLLIDDDEDLRETLTEQLTLHEEFEPLEATTASQGIDLAREGSADLILLDVGLPDIDGREACRIMRKAGVKIPIVMISGADTDADTILALESGANDYVTNPFRFGVLRARMRAQLRQYEQSEDAIFQIGPYTFKPAAKLLIRASNGSKIRLTEKETSILKYLYRAGGDVVSRDELLNRVWGYKSAVMTNTLEAHVYRLRHKMEDEPTEARLLTTEPGGYKLKAS